MEGVGSLGLLDWTLSPEQIATSIEEVLGEARKAVKVIEELPEDLHTFKHTAKALSDIHGYIFSRGAKCTFPSLVATEPAVRAASSEAKQKVQEFFIDLHSNAKVYHSLSNANKAAASATALTDKEDKRLIQKFLEDMERNGMGLEKEKRETLVDLRKEISRLELEFNNNVNEDKTELLVTQDQLKGMDAAYLKGLKSAEDSPDGKKQYLVSLKYPELYPALRKCLVASTRESLEAAFNTRGKGKNEKILAEILRLRKEAAELLGIKMAKTPEKVAEFLEDVSSKLKDLRDKQLEELKSLKANDLGLSCDSSEVTMNEHDWRFYMNLLKEQKYSVDAVQVQQYFPMGKVLKGTLDTYQRLLGLTFTKITGAEKNVWHEDVHQYKVHMSTSGKFLGTFYLDLHPRDGKYSHAACFPVQIGYEGDKEHGRVTTVSAMVANFTKPAGDTPSLLQHSEVVTLFHEFGHVMHSITSRSRYSRLNWTWTAVEQDFLECPSMMLENWAWEGEVLRTISAHHSKEGNPPLPEELLEKMLKARKVDQALSWSRLISMCQVDMKLHSAAPPATEEEITQLWKQKKHQYFGVQHTEGTSPIASWQHLTTGYNAGYYGYLWAKVISADMYTRFKKEGPLNEETGKSLRTAILEPCCIETGESMLANFLGREPTLEPFLVSVGALEE